MCVLSIKIPVRKKSGNVFKDPRKNVCVCMWLLYRLIFFIKLHINLRGLFNTEAIFKEQ